MTRTTSVAPPTAHLVGPGRLRVVNGRLVFTCPDRPGVRLDPAALHSLACYGSVSFSDEALRVLLAGDVSVSIMSAGGSRCRGRVVGRRDSAALLRMLQHDVLRKSELQLQVARTFVVARIDSQIHAVRHFQRHGHASAAGVPGRLRQQLQAAKQAATTNQLRGAEGGATAAWFEFMGQLFPQQWTFTKRTRRPPLDPVNALLSLSATWLLNRVLAELEGRGLETSLGALHEFRHGRPSLACDIVEPLRVAASERWTLDVCRRNLVNPSDFTQSERGVRVSRSEFPRLLANWEQQWHQSINQFATKTIEEFCRTIRSLGRLETEPDSVSTTDEDDQRFTQT